MKYSKTCECCGHKVTAYTLMMNEPLCRAFIAFAKERIRLGRPLKKGEIGLSNAQYSNFQNLRHFGIIRQEDKGGAWDVTLLGWMWLSGEARIHSPTAHMGGKTLLYNHEAWDTHPVKPEFITIRERFPELWKERPEYQEEKSNQTRFDQIP